MNDSYETKAAVLGSKEGSSLPIFVTCVFDEGGKQLLNYITGSLFKTKKTVAVKPEKIKGTE